MNRYRTIVADPPWIYDEGWPSGNGRSRIPLPYTALPLGHIAMLPIEDLAEDDAHLLLWAPNRYVIDAHAVARAWGFKPSALLTWCKPPMGVGPGGVFATTTEFVIYARRGKPKHTERMDSSWWAWPRSGGHSAKPEAFLDLVERALPGPYLELFARRQRIGWDTWGNEVDSHVELPA